MGRTAFTPAELDAIKALLREIRSAERSRQKSLRARLRRQFDFYITDFASDQQGFVASDVDALVRRGVIALVRVGKPPAPERSTRVAEKQSPRARTTSGSSSGQPAPPLSFSRRELGAVGFTGWRAWTDLRTNAFADVPGGPGVYVVYRPASADPAFLATNPGGHFKGRDPTVTVERLADNWVEGAHVIYLGKADRLRVRLRQYARFGAGDPVGH
jgi:hypothetical protein